MTTSKSIPSDEEYQVLLADPNDPDDDGGYVYGEGDDEEWHIFTCPCELCKVQTRLEWEDHTIATPNIECEGEDCQGCGRLPRHEATGRPLDDILKEEDEWLISRLNTTNPDVAPDYWRNEVEAGAFNLPEPPPPPSPSPSYPGFSQYVRTVALKSESRPALLQRSDGATLLYAGKTCTVFGEPGAGKSWIGLKAAQSVLAKGGRVLWWDFEDSPDSLHRRADLIGALDAFIGPNLAFVDSSILELTDEGIPNPGLASTIEWLAKAGWWDEAGRLAKAGVYSHEWWAEAERLGKAGWLAEAGMYSLVVIDAAESSGAPSDGSSVAAWFKQMVEPFIRRGIAVLILDHVPKRRQDRPPGAIGSQHKRAKMDASLYISGKPWNSQQGGAMVLRLDKDKLGDIPGTVGTKIATVKGQYVDGMLNITIDPPGQEDGEEADIPMQLLIAIADAGPDGVRGTDELKKLVKGKGQYKAQAIIGLIQDGLITSTKDGKANVHKLTDAARIILEDEGV